MVTAMTNEMFGLENETEIDDDYDMKMEGTHDYHEFNFMEQYNQDLQRVYELGLLHGINAQSMSQAKVDVMEFDDYGWRMDND